MLTFGHAPVFVGLLGWPVGTGRAERLASTVALAFACSAALKLGDTLARIMEPVLYVENNKFAQQVLKCRMEDGCLPTAPIAEDVLGVNGAEWRNKADAVVAGFPCQARAVATAVASDCCLLNCSFLFCCWPPQCTCRVASSSVSHPPFPRFMSSLLVTRTFAPSLRCAPGGERCWQAARHA